MESLLSGKRTHLLHLPPISVVVPAYNEAQWLPATLDQLLATGLPDEVIVVDDGSTDGTWETLAAYRDRVVTLRHPRNRGKGAALATGIRHTQGEIVVFCDAHLKGLKPFHVLALVLPLVETDVRVVLGLDVPTGLSPAMLRPLPLFMLTGQRAYFREDLLPLVDDMEALGYGVETFLFRHFPREKTALVLLPGLEHVSKREKVPAWKAVRGYLREVTDISNTLWNLALKGLQLRPPWPILMEDKDPSAEKRPNRR